MGGLAGTDTASAPIERDSRGSHSALGKSSIGSISFSTAVAASSSGEMSKSVGPLTGSLWLGKALPGSACKDASHWSVNERQGHQTHLSQAGRPGHVPARSGASANLQVGISTPPRPAHGYTPSPRGESKGAMGRG